MSTNNLGLCSLFQSHIQMTCPESARNLPLNPTSQAAASDDLAPTYLRPRGTVPRGFFPAARTEAKRRDSAISFFLPELQQLSQVGSPGPLGLLRKSVFRAAPESAGFVKERQKERQREWINTNHFSLRPEASVRPGGGILNLRLLMLRKLIRVI